MATARDVAEWMAEDVKANGYLYPGYAATEIRSLFGDEFISADAHGDPSMSQAVLSEFRKLTDGWVVWELKAKRWAIL